LAAYSALLLLLVSTTCSVSRAADYTKVGVKQGTQATYSVSYIQQIGNSSDEDTLTVTVYIENVTAPFVALNETAYWSNGTFYQTAVTTINVASGESAPHYLFNVYLLAANLTKSDPIQLRPTAPTINDTTQMTVAGHQRTVNLLNYTYIQTWSEYQHFGYRWMRWDKPTGLLAEDVQYSTTVRVDTHGEQTYFSHYSVNWTLVSTTAFGESGDLGTLVIFIAACGGLAVVLIVGVAVALRRSGK
jgi:hypothetical protein